MSITIKSFGQLTEITAHIIILEESKDTDDLRNQLEKRFPLLQNRKYAIAVDRKIITNMVKLNEASSVALLPPFSGG